MYEIQVIQIKDEKHDVRQKMVRGKASLSNASNQYGC
jgi:hypothetical protein